LYNIKRENPFEERLLICKVAKTVVVHFQVVAYKEIVKLSKRMGSVEEISSKCCKFFKCGKTHSSSFLKLSSFKVKVFGIKFFELLGISTLKFEKVCGREFFNSLKV
jgi:hypothetical protein